MDRVNYSPLYEIYTDRQNDEGVIARSESSIMRLPRSTPTQRVAKLAIPDGTMWRRKVVGASGVVRALRRLLTALVSSLTAVLRRWWLTHATVVAVASPQPQPRYFALFKPYMVLCSWERDAPCKNGRAPRTTLADLGLPSGVPHGLFCYRAFSWSAAAHTRLALRELGMHTSTRSRRGMRS